MSVEASSTGSSTMHKATGKILSALVRMVVYFGITFPELVEWLKRAYVREVERELTKQGDKVTMSRISVVSGVHRKDVKRFLEENNPSATASEKSSITARILSLWLGDSRYLDASGQPRVLERTGDDSFDSLVTSISKDIRSRTVLDDLIQREVVFEKNKQLVLNLDALFPSDDLETKIEFLARNVSDHIATCQRNLQGNESPLPERSVFYDKLSEESVDELQRYAAEQSQQLILKINQLAQRLAENDDKQSLAESHRFLLGTYFYREKEEKHRDS